MERKRMKPVRMWAVVGKRGSIFSIHRRAVAKIWADLLNDAPAAAHRHRRPYRIVRVRVTEEK